MKVGNALHPAESLNSEDCLRLDIEHMPLLYKLRHEISAADYAVVAQLFRSFPIPQSGIGLVALIEAIIRDLAAIKKTIPQFVVPAWSHRIAEIAQSVGQSLNTDPSRDLTALRNLPRQPLRDYLAPFGNGLEISKIRLLQAVRGLLTLLILSSKSSLTTDVAKEIARWVSGRLPTGLEPGFLTPHLLTDLAGNRRLNTNTCKLLNQLAGALRSKLDNPFEEAESAPSLIVERGASTKNLEQSDNGVELDSAEPATERDLLSDRLVEQANATRRMFAGVVTSRELQPFELELTFPRILELFDGELSDEAFAAESALHLKVQPSQFHQLTITGNTAQGYGITWGGKAICLELNRITGESTNAETTDIRFVFIPLPEEFHQRIQARLVTHPEAKTYDQLFDVPMKELHLKARAMLRSISISSHRVTLTRLTRTRGRYVLDFCRDEAYSALIGLDFLLGTTANFNYLTIRGDRLKSILRECYQRIGYSGVLATDDIPDVPSPHLPNAQQVTTLLTRLTTELATTIASFPKHCRIENLIAAHSRVTANIYALIKFLNASRPLEIETLTRSQLDLNEAIAGISDKRVSPYHELRAVSLPDYLISWLKTYIGWLRLISNRLSSVEPGVAAFINSVAAPANSNDLHPLFFALANTMEAKPIGSRVLAAAVENSNIALNAGRHWVDAIARDANIDSAAIMGYVGRGNPGQELFGRWSGATPAIALHPVAQAIDHWLERIELPPAPTIEPRNYQGDCVPGDAPPYLPKLLETNTAWMETPLPLDFGIPEPCPFSRSSVAEAANFPEIFQCWRNSSPAPGWLGVALSLILEDGVVHENELLGALAELASGTIYQSEERVFLDHTTKTLGIRRTDLSVVTLQLASKVPIGEASPTTVSALDRSMKSWSVQDNRNLSLSDLLAKAEAYLVFHIPAAVSAWARGITFARTTRPATVARHMYGCIEPPTFNMQRRARRTTIPGSVADALEQAKAKRQQGGSHESALLALHKALSELEKDGSDSLHARLQTGYLMELAGSLKNFNTLVRYESGARNFVQLAADAIEQSGADNIEWKQVIQAALIERQEGSAPDITAIQSVLRWLGIDIHLYQRTSAPPSAMHFGELISKRELNTAANLLDAQKTHSCDDYHLASIALRLLGQLPLRWDSVAHLRLCDLALDNPSPHLSVSQESGADLKSGNAIRVLRIRDSQLLMDLQEIAELRRSRFPGDIQVRIFGDINDPRTIDTAKRIHHLITEALWHATGSPVACVHDLRHRVITDRIQTLLAPNAHLRFDTLELRQGLIKCAVDAGHSWPQVSVENYVHDMEVLRTQHYRNLISQLTPPSDTFAAAITGIASPTLRKRRSRNHHFKQNLAEGFSWEKFRRDTTIIPLSSLVACDQDHIPITPEVRGNQTQSQHAVYVGLRLLGDPPEVASRLSGITTEQVQPFEFAFASSPQRLGSILRARKDISREAFLKDVLGTGIALAMTVVQPDRSSIFRIEKSLPNAGDEWRFSCAQDALDLAPWVRIFEANGICTELLIRPSTRSTVDSGILGQARHCGFHSARTLPARHFERNTDAVLRFFPRPLAAVAPTRIRASPQAAFLVGACALAVLYNKSGINNA